MNGTGTSREERERVMRAKRRQPRRRHSLDVYCGKCADCQDLDGWLKVTGRRMPWPKNEDRVTTRTSWPAIARYLEMEMDSER